MFQVLIVKHRIGDANLLSLSNQLFAFTRSGTVMSWGLQELLS